ncbi:cell division protein [Sulfolobus sp. S-194]|uniref:cell division protein CdvA n=1 Tax=Sulfolobus sp. S-194 TaxID=2512240 RepID=UPI001437224A|nr:cell division protein CdvA [Sulfolobus sp. S-194]QIW24129.1 cell division protein [Sulfolobus sp. S-194]
MPISVDVLTKFIGQKVKDVYGRDVGSIIHVYTEIDGTITGIEISYGNSFVTVSPESVKMDGDNIVLLPEWKTEAIKILGYMEKIRRRQKALEELYSKQEIPKSMYDDMKRKLDSELLKLREEHAKLKSKLKNRLNEIEDQLAQIDKATISLKMSYISGELPETSYKNSMEILRQSKESYTLERDDIKKILDKLDGLDKEGIDIKPSPSLTTQQEQSNKNDGNKSEVPLPIPVRVINTL